MNDGPRTETTAEIARGPFPWQRGWSIVKAIWPQLMYISMVSIAIPQYLVYWVSSRRAASMVQDLATRPPKGFFPLLEKVESFSFASLLELFLVGLMSLWGYLAWVTAAWEHIDGHTVRTSRVLATSLRIFLPRGVLTFMLFAIVLIALGALTAANPSFGIVSQLLLITLCVVAAAAPALLIMERGGPARILSAAVRMDYTRASGISRWSAYFILLTYEMLLMGGLTLVDVGLETLNHLDAKMGLPRAIWFVASETFPFGLVPMLTEGLGICLSALIFALFAVMTTSFIADVRRIGRIRSTIDIRI